LTQSHFAVILGDGLGEGYGMLGQAGSGKLRISAGQSKLAAKVAKKYVTFVLYPLWCFASSCHFLKFIVLYIT
jgi:hypothetical protein